MIGPHGSKELRDNVGVRAAWLMEMVPTDGIRRPYDVNVFGQITVFLAFLPLAERVIRQSTD